MSILFFALASLGLIASYLTWAGNKNAPMAYEDENGFHVVCCDECSRFKQRGRQRRCALGYPTRPSFFRHGRAGGCPAQGSAP
jgi:hypothetical protein